MPRQRVGDAPISFYIPPYMSDTNDKTSIAGTPRALQRPDHVKPPEGWENPPLPEPRDPVIEQGADQPGGRDPVRYGDWELKGIAVDF